jgi:DNA-binding FrmR family transcriptional regulator
MSHVLRNKNELLKRVRRVRGQVEAVERALTAEKECFEVLQLIAACRGAMNGLMAEVIEDHIRFHFGGHERKGNPPSDADTEALVRVMRSYLK